MTAAEAHCPRCAQVRAMVAGHLDAWGHVRAEREVQRAFAAIATAARLQMEEGE